jgi:glyoxylase-like metal-dependent hydrolase (beta-lactamase superfamily II)
MVINKKNSKILELGPKLYLIPSMGVGSHVYLIKGAVKNVLIDTGLPANFGYLKESLSDVGLKPDDIDLIILSHEHWDHIGAASLFVETSIIAAHYLAANKIMIGDEFVLMNKYFDQPLKSFRPDIWLDENTVIDLGNYKLNIVHTPGHCSGCICLHEPEKEILFTGDTIMAGGVLSGIYTSGSIADYIDSLNRLKALKVREIYPSHGKTSNTPRQDLNKAIERSFMLMNETRILFDNFDTKQIYKRLLSSARNYSSPKQRLDRKKEVKDIEIKNRFDSC